MFLSIVVGPLRRCLHPTPIARPGLDEPAQPVSGHRQKREETEPKDQGGVFQKSSQHSSHQIPTEGRLHPGSLGKDHGKHNSGEEERQQQDQGGPKLSCQEIAAGRPARIEEVGGQQRGQQQAVGPARAADAELRDHEVRQQDLDHDHAEDVGRIGREAGKPAEPSAHRIAEGNEQGHLRDEQGGYPGVEQDPRQHPPTGRKGMPPDQLVGGSQRGPGEGNHAEEGV